MRRTFTIFALALVFCLANAQDGTFLFGQNGGVDLYLDYYSPTEGSQTSIDGKEKPSIIFMFGGGFITGTRMDAAYLPWYKALNNNGYRVFAIDYRLGLVGATKAGIGQAKDILNAVEIAVEDLYSATSYIVENADQFGVDPNNIVISGSSAGAISVLQADWKLCNGEAKGQLPDGFKYAGVISFAGAIISNHGAVRYKENPAPTMFLHGTKDQIVNYGKMWFFNWRLAGTDVLSRLFTKKDYEYNILRYLGHGHDIAAAIMTTFPEQIRFLETNITKKVSRKIDVVIEDDEVEVMPELQISRKELYGGQSN